MDIRSPHISPGRCRVSTTCAPINHEGLSASSDTPPTDGVAWTSGPRLPGASRVSVVNPFSMSSTVTAPPPHINAPVRHEAAAEEASATPLGNRLMGMLALGLSGIGVIGGIATLPTPAMAQTVQSQALAETPQTTETDTRMRDARPVRAQSIDDAVRRFDRSHQLYVVGNPKLNGTPLVSDDLARYREVLREHPNVYVVLIERTDDIKGDDLRLSRGIGNSSAFESVVNPQTGERDGAVFMIYHNVDGNPNARKIFMRAESMLDRVGVGEAAFAAPDGTPGPLLQQFVHAFKDEGKDIPGALETVMTTMQSRVDADIRQTHEAATREAQAARDAADRASTVRHEIAAAVALAVIATGVVANRRASAAGAKAQKELDAAVAEIGVRSNELMDLLNTADVHEVAAYEGKTKEVADRLRENVVEALTLVGGAQKFVDEANQLVHAKGVGAVRNMFTTGRYNDALALLTDPNRTLSFSLHDASRAVMEKGSKADTWREQILAQGDSRAFQKSLRDVLLAMADSRDAARANLAEIESKSADINGYLQKIEGAAAKARSDAAALQQKAPDGLFTAPSVTTNLMPAVLSSAAEGGLLAKGQKLAAHNFVTAWDDCAVPAERMTGDAAAIVSTGSQARQALLPAVTSADAALNANGVKTDWAHTAQESLSNRLDQLANKALRTGVTDDITALGNDVAALKTRVETAVRLDGERREVVPGVITAAENDIEAGRTALSSALKSAGAFKNGTPDQVLREPDRDPSTRTSKARGDVEAAKGTLDVGDVDKTDALLTDAREQSADAHRLVAESREAVSAHSATLHEREQRTGAIDVSIPTTYTPALGRIKKTYAGDVLRKVAAEVGAGDTLADSIDRSLAAVTEARQHTASAVTNFDRAWVLGSRDDLTAADTSLRQAQGLLEAITHAENVLADRQRGVEQASSELGARYAKTRASAAQSFVRDQARSLMEQADTALRGAQGAVTAHARDPYLAEERIAVAENLRQQVDSAIAADARALEQANLAISSAESSVISATAQVAAAAGQSWSWSNSYGSAHEQVSGLDLAGAYTALAAAGARLARARGEVGAQQYEAAEASAENASAEATQAATAAAFAVSSARSRFDAEVRQLERLEAEARRAEEERRAAEARREEEARQASSSSSSGGSFSGGGGSGSRGGDF